MQVEKRIVDNRVFVLGLDELFRSAMKEHESEVLLPCAEDVARVLSVEPVKVPVEGYYTESPELTRYFLLMRALQAVNRSREREVSNLKSFIRLKQVTTSPIVGQLAESGSLLPSGIDSLYKALKQTFPNWTVPIITQAAYDLAVETDDYSLVTLSALTKDPVVIAACRETTVLYAEVYLGMDGTPTDEPEYVWQVDDVVQQRAFKFIETFNKLVGMSLPEPCDENACEYYEAYELNEVCNRCVRIGYDDARIPIRHYHWAIDVEQGEYVVRDFWDTQLWTTEMYHNREMS